MSTAVAAQALDTRDRLVMEHVWLVKVIAHRLMRRLPSKVETSDLVSVGVLGLIDAAGRYQASTGVPFDAYARRRINGAMLDALRELDWAPRSLRRLRRDVDGAVSALRNQLRRDPMESEIADAMRLSPAEYGQAIEQLRTLEIGQIRELDAPMADGSTLLELVLDPGETPVTQLMRQELRDHLARAIQDLPERERHIIALYYEQELTLAEIGKVIGVGESRVCQLRALAISRLRGSLRTSLGLQEVA